jgi:CxxC motif-containing protein (DUF1111 family)
MIVTRAGHHDSSGHFISAPNGGVLHTHFAEPTYTGQVGVTENIQGQRVAINLLGDGYIEAIEDSSILEIAEEQRKSTDGRISGQVVYAPFLEAPGKTAVGRFGWKCQHASLLSSAADSLRSELGITNRLYPSVGSWTKVTNSKDSGSAIDELAAFYPGDGTPVWR